MTRSVSWLDAQWVSYDTETTGVNVESDLILQAALVGIDLEGAFGGGVAPVVRHLNWDVDVPEGAAAIHGLTREKLREIGEEPAKVIAWQRDTLAAILREGSVIVGMNLSFDLTMLDRNCRRLGLDTLGDLVEIAPVVDAFVLDKHVDPYRKGKRNLEALAEHYRVPFQGAHDAAVDALGAARVCWRIGRIFPQIGAMDPNVLHDLQVDAKLEQDASFRQYLLKNGKPADGVDGHWPIRPLPVAAVAQADKSVPGGYTPSLLEDGDKPPWD